MRDDGVLDPRSPSLPRDRGSGSVFWIGLALLMALLILIVFWRSLVVSVYPGQAGVKWLRFWGGTQLNRVYGEGTHFMAPWNRMYIYDVRVHEMTTTVPVLARGALRMDILVSVRYRPVTRDLPRLHQEIGPDYAQKVIAHEVASLIQEIMGKLTYEQISTTAWDQHQAILVRAQSREFASAYLDVEDVMVKRLVLPPTLNAAVENKFAEEQAVLAWGFRLERERREAERKAVEADGIRRFTEVVAGGLSDRFLAWKGIEATAQLANSPNAKVVVIGRNADGLPIIFDTPLGPGGAAGRGATTTGPGLATAPIATAPLATAPLATAGAAAPVTTNTVPAPVTTTPTAPPVRRPSVRP